MDGFHRLCLLMLCGWLLQSSGHLRFCAPPRIPSHLGSLTLVVAEHSTFVKARQEKSIKSEKCAHDWCPRVRMSQVSDLVAHGACTQEALPTRKVGKKARRAFQGPPGSDCRPPQLEEVLFRAYSSQVAPVDGWICRLPSCNGPQSWMSAVTPLSVAEGSDPGGRGGRTVPLGRTYGAG